MEDRPTRARTMPAAALDELVAAVVARGFDVIGPIVRQGAVDLAPVRSLRDLPVGVADAQDGGRYRLRERHDGAIFGFSNGPASWKGWLHPPRTRLWEVDTDAEPPVYRGTAEAPVRPAVFLGVRPCDLAAIAVLDKVLAHDEHYSVRRAGTVIVAVDCGQAGGTCFCASTGTGPVADGGFDLALTELIDDERHDFLVKPGSALGEALLEALPTREATDEDVARAARIAQEVAASMGRTLEVEGLPERIADAAQSPHWEDVAARCLTCGNCTMVCPTCFCTDMQDTSDLSGTHAERWREWQSCFTLDFSYAMGGSVRSSAASRYRQWLTHKLSTWVDQFGTLGCIGCGRCITWCPVGIDITAEAKALAALPSRGEEEVAP